MYLHTTSQVTIIYIYIFVVFCQITHTVFWMYSVPVVILETVNLANLPLGKTLLSDLLFTCCAGETKRMVRSLESPDHVVCDDVTTRPAQFQTGLETEKYD